MALPSIVDIAEENGIQFNPRNKTNAKELTALCPFCENHRKFYLSINQLDNVFQCWYCRASGGVLQFEADLTGKSFSEVREKYFGKRTRKLHPAEQLSPRQLDGIGWLDTKRKDRHEFKRSLKKVKFDWDTHVFKYRELSFGLLLLSEMKMASDYQTIIETIQELAKKAQIPTLVEDVLNMYSKSIWDDWAYEGQRLARSAKRVAKKAEDNNENLYIMFLWTNKHENLFENEKPLKMEA